MDHASAATEPRTLVPIGRSPSRESSDSCRGAPCPRFVLWMHKEISENNIWSGTTAVAAFALVDHVVMCWRILAVVMKDTRGFLDLAFRSRGSRFFLGVM